MDSGFMAAYAAAMAARGVEMVRFEFDYMATRRMDGKKRPPDRAAKLLDRWHQVLDGFQSGGAATFIGGKSMGGRMASLYAAERSSAGLSGVICLGYPFHPVAKPDKLRIEHLRHIELPCLVVQGQRDRFGSQDEVSGYTLSQSVIVRWLEASDHDFTPLKSSGLTQSEMIDTAARYTAQFIQNLNGP